MKHLILLLFIVLFLGGCTEGSISSFNKNDFNSQVKNGFDHSMISDNAVQKQTGEQVFSENVQLDQVNKKNNDHQEIDYQIIEGPEKEILEIKNKKTNQVIISDLPAICGNEMMVYARPAHDLIIVRAFDPGSDRPVVRLWQLDLVKKECRSLSVFTQMTDFGARILSPDQTKIALALETNDARELKLVDLINDEIRVLVGLPEWQSFNAGYGALSNHFEIEWVDNNTIKYSVFGNRYGNYDLSAPAELEKKIGENTVSF